jgi:hypothetical protein
MIMAMVHGGSLREAAISERPIACCARWPLSVQRLGFAPHNRFGRLAHEVVGNFFAADPPQFYQVPFGCHSIDPIKESLIDAGFNDIRVHVIALEKEISGALKTVLATPATCANSTGNSSASPRETFPLGPAGAFARAAYSVKAAFGSVVPVLEASTPPFWHAATQAVMPSTINPAANRDFFRTRKPFAHESVM